MTDTRTAGTSQDAPVLSGVKLYVAGHSGLAGSAITRALLARGYRDLVTRSHAELNLTDQAATREFFQRERPAVVFLCAARVGGIGANSRYPAEFIHTNLAIQTNVIHEAWAAGVERLVFLGSSCIYPRECPQPMKEEHLLSAPLEPTNRPYAVAKIAGVELCWAYNRQYGTRYLALMPTNLFGPGDNYDLQSSHVLPALIRRMHEAKCEQGATVTLWGTGNPRREFLYSDDLAAAALHLLELPQRATERVFGDDHPPLINVGWGKDVSIRELAERVREEVGFAGGIEWDASKPDGTPRKLLDTTYLRSLGWAPSIGLREGIRLAYRDFLRGAAQAPSATIPDA